MLPAANLLLTNWTEETGHCVQLQIRGLGRHRLLTKKTRLLARSVVEANATRRIGRPSRIFFRQKSLAGKPMQSHIGDRLWREHCSSCWHGFSEADSEKLNHGCGDVTDNNGIGCYPYHKRHSRAELIGPLVVGIQNFNLPLGACI